MKDEDRIKHFTLEYAKSVKRKPQNAEDWGDQDTVGVCLKTRDHGSTCQFGRYLGLIDGKYWIGTFLADAFTPGPALGYESIEDMKKDWILD